mmetsp:Transcript_68260/g.181746  ORF Transcript_68260/g.181746 Transcript_68260/m.181746 type:complete len:190 (-) Transcript_68260:47-616(-)
MHTTKQVFKERQSQFGPFVSFMNGKCQGANCTESVWSQYGYVVGCQTQAGSPYGLKTFWASLPGSCPDQERGKKSAACVKQYPGGRCDGPNGTSTCTWTAEEDGMIKLDQLEGLTMDYQSFCRAGNKEYDPVSDKGLGCSFWDNLKDTEQNKKRIEALRAMFETQAPNSTMPDPICDWNPPQTETQVVV